MNYFGTINSQITQFSFNTSPIQQILTSSKIHQPSKKPDQNFNLQVDGGMFSLYLSHNLSSRSFSICSEPRPISRMPTYDLVQIIDSITDLYLVSLSTINSSDIKQNLQFFKQRIEKESLTHHNHHQHEDPPNSTHRNQTDYDQLPKVAFFVNTFEEEETEDWKELERHKFWSLSREVQVLEEEKSKTNTLTKSRKRGEMEKLTDYHKMLTPFSELEEFVHELFPSSMIISYKYPASNSFTQSYYPKSKVDKERSKKKEGQMNVEKEVQKIFEFVSEVIESVGVCEHTQRKKQNIEKKICQPYYSNSFTYLPPYFQTNFQTVEPELLHPQLLQPVVWKPQSQLQPQPQPQPQNSLLSQILPQTQTQTNEPLPQISFTDSIKELLSLKIK